MLVIAEIGLNHRGDEAAARRMLAAVLAAGVRHVTFQVRERAFYDGSKPWKRPLSMAFYEEVLAADAEIGFAVADVDAVALLDRAGASFFKSLSWDLGNDALQAALARTGKHTWISTGVSDLAQIRAAAEGRAAVGFIHTQLSAAIADQNVRAIDSIRAATGKPVAFGLHCKDHRVLHMALAMRPDAFFVYVKEGDDGPYPDDAHAVRLGDLAVTVSDLTMLAPAAGTGEKIRMERKL